MNCQQPVEQHPYSIWSRRGRRSCISDGLVEKVLNLNNNNGFEALILPSFQYSEVHGVVEIVAHQLQTSGWNQSTEATSFPHALYQSLITFCPCWRSHIDRRQSFEQPGIVGLVFGFWYKFIQNPRWRRNKHQGRSFLNGICPHWSRARREQEKQLKVVWGKHCRLWCRRQWGVDRGLQCHCKRPGSGKFTFHASAAEGAHAAAICAAIMQSTMFLHAGMTYLWMVSWGNSTSLTVLLSAIALPLATLLLHDMLRNITTGGPYQAARRVWSKPWQFHQRI